MHLHNPANTPVLEPMAQTNEPKPPKYLLNAGREGTDLAVLLESLSGKSNG